MFPQAGAPNQRTWADRPIAGPFQIQTGTDGLDYALASSPVREPLPNSTLGWHVVVRQPLDRMLADKATLERDLLVFALLAALLMTGLIWWVATRLGRPIHDLTCYVREVREGNAVPPPFAGGGASEVNALIADTVAMTQTLLDQKQALMHSADRLTQEVNERRAAEQQAKAHAEKLRLAIDAAHLGVWEWRAGEKEVTWSDTCLSHFGQPPGTRVTFAEWRALVHPEDWPRIEAAIAESVAKRCDYSEDYRVTWPDGTEHWIRAIGRPFYDETGRAERMAGVIQEVTARKHHALQIELLNRQLARRALDAETANRAKEAFLRAVSHELRTPLNHIMGGLDILLRSQPDAKQEKWLTTVKASSKDLLGLINSILDATYLAAGQAELESVPFSPATVMQEVCLMLAPRAEAKGLDLTVKPNPELPDEVRGDPARLAQALYNYVDNGIKFTERGSVTLWTQTVLSDDRKGILIQFAVSDTGIGVDARQRENLFSSFTQGDGSTTRKYGGLGIGLANTQSLAKLMGGEVGMDSDPGRGSTFWFTARLKPTNGTGE